LVAVAGSDREAAGVIGKELADWLYHDKDLVEWHSNRSRQNHKRRRHWRLGFFRLDILALLGKMAHDCFVCIRTVPSCIRVGEAIKGVTVASFDGI
jgi:hypothetical protein